MRLPRTSKQAGGLAGAIVAGAALTALVISSQAGAHPGPVDTSGGHYCTQAQNASGLCAPPTYHRHDEGGNIRVVTPGPEAAQLTGQQGAATTAQPFTPGGAPAPTTAPPAPAPAPATPPPAAPLADTGPIDMQVALFGAVLFAAGLAALVAHRRIPLPVILEFDRP